MLYSFDISRHTLGILNKIPKENYFNAKEEDRKNHVYKHILILEEMLDNAHKE